MRHEIELAIERLAKQISSGKKTAIEDMQMAQAALSLANVVATLVNAESNK